MNPGPFSMRELWFMACGKWDQTVSLQLLVLSGLGGKQPPDAFQRMHPLRAMEIPPPTAEELAELSALAFDVLGRGLKTHHQQHTGG